jgi:NADP-dependent 3-hydroxy acid dehydrogenase YdfG
MLRTSFFGVVKTVNAVLPHFRSRCAGTIAFMNSVNAYAPFSGVAGYIVAKHAVAGEF